MVVVTGDVHGKATVSLALMLPYQKWHLQKSASDDEVKIELRPVLAQFKANLSFPTPEMLLSGL